MTKQQAEIIVALAGNDMKISITADELYMHRNTITYHLERVKKETGKDPMNFYDLIELVETAKKVLEGERVKVRYKLDKEAIAALVAEKYGVKPKDVTVTVEEVWTGSSGEYLTHEPVVYFAKES